MRSSDLRRADALAGVALVLFGAAVSWQAARLRVGSLSSPGPGLLPLGLGLGLVVLAVWVILEAVSDRAPAERPTAAPSTARRALVVLALVLAAAFLLEPLGYLVTMTLVTALLLRVAQHRWWTAALMGLTATVLTFLLFEGVLRLRLPRGVLEIV